MIYEILFDDYKKEVKSLEVDLSKKIFLIIIYLVWGVIELVLLKFQFIIMFSILLILGFFLFFILGARINKPFKNKTEVKLQRHYILLELFQKYRFNTHDKIFIEKLMEESKKMQHKSKKFNFIYYNYNFSIIDILGLFITFFLFVIEHELDVYGFNLILDVLTFSFAWLLVIFYLIKIILGCLEPIINKDFYLYDDFIDDLNQLNIFLK